MRYILKAGRVLSQGEWVALGAVLELDDDEAARYRLGGCTLEPVKAKAEPKADSIEANDAEHEPEKPRRGRRRKAAAEPDEG